MISDGFVIDPDFSSAVCVVCELLLYEDCTATS